MVPIAPKTPQLKSPISLAAAKSLAKSPAATNLPTIRLLPQRHKRVEAGHPWIYSNEIAMDAAAKTLLAGTLVRFETAQGALLGLGSFQPHNLIAGRMLTRRDETIDQNWFLQKLSSALALREKLFPAGCYRLCHAEADGLPGLIIDRYGQDCVLQVNSAGMAMLQPQIIAALQELLAPRSIILRNDSAARLQEGLTQTVTVAHGTMPERLQILENELHFVANPASGQKTGWFYDQRANRALVAKFCQGARVLDVCTHTGGFALNAAAAGASSVIGLDSSEAALSLAAEVAALNRLQAKMTWQRGEAFAALAAYAEQKEKFDVIILDPPAFIKSRKDLAAGVKGYRKLVRLAAVLLRPSAILFFASCSHPLTLELLTEQLAMGLKDAGREGQILHTVFAAADHPLHPQLPESAYLKGQLLRVRS
jgi:23S rRNA (cytosine1962-C5)-methyltransferase